MAITVTDADIYFNENILHNTEWVEADNGRKQRALNNAVKQLLRAYRTYNETDRLLPDEAVFEQAIWLLRADDAILKAQQGVRSLTVAGVTISVEKLPNFICPESRLILSRRVGRYV